MVHSQTKRVSLLLVFLWAAAFGRAQIGTGDVGAFGNIGLGQSLNSVSPIRQVAAANGFSAALRADGTVVCWGSNAQDQCDVPPRLSGIVQIACGTGHCIALRSNGTVACWGSNANGESTPPAGLGGVVQVAAGPGYSIAVKSDGTIAAWGTSAPVTKASNVQLAFARDYDCVLVYRDGTL